MKPKRSKQMQTHKFPDGNWIDVDDLVKPGEIKEIMPGVWVNNTGVVLDPPEPIRRPAKGKSQKRKN
jgi:hypothetical protein